MSDKDPGKLPQKPDPNPDRNFEILGSRTESNRTEFGPCGPKCQVQSPDRMRKQTTRTVPWTDRYPSGYFIFLLLEMAPDGAGSNLVQYFLLHTLMVIPW